MAWRVEVSAGARKALGKIDPQAARAILKFLDEKVARASDPRRAHRIRIAVRSAATATYARTMNSLTIKLPAALERELALASQREHLTKSELVRRAVAAYVARPPGIGPFVSALEQAGDLVGCFKGGPKDLASNPKHMAKFGQP